MSHILDGNARHDIHILVTNPHQKSMDTMMLVVNRQLREYNDMFSVNSAVGDPVFLCQCRGRVYDELLSGLQQVTRVTSHWSLIS